MNEIFLGYYSSYNVINEGGIPKVELFGLETKECANYRVTIIGGILCIFQNSEFGGDDRFVERALSNFDVEFMGIDSCLGLQTALYHGCNVAAR